MPYNEEGVWIGDPEDQPQKSLATLQYGGKGYGLPGGLREINGRQYTRFDPSYWTPEMFYGNKAMLDPYLQAIQNQKIEDNQGTWIPAELYAQSQTQMYPFSREAHPSWASNFSEAIGKGSVPFWPAAMGGAAAAGAGGGAAAAAAASTANQQALYQMAFDVGLEGAAADAFGASGGTMGSTAAGGGGVGLGAATGTAAAPGVTSPVG